MREKVKLCMEFAKELLLSEGHVRPVAIIGAVGEQDGVIPLPMRTEKEKYETQDKIRAMIITERPDYVIIVTEGWIVQTTVKQAEKYKMGDAEKSKKRKEGIIVVGGSVDEIYGLLQTFHRGENEDEIILDEKAFDKIDSNEGLSYETAFFGDAWKILRAEKTIVSNRVH